MDVITKFEEFLRVCLFIVGFDLAVDVVVGGEVSLFSIFHFYKYDCNWKLNLNYNEWKSTNRSSKSGRALSEWWRKSGESQMGRSWCGRKSTTKKWPLFKDNKSSPKSISWRISTINTSSSTMIGSSRKINLWSTSWWNIARVVTSVRKSKGLFKRKHTLMKKSFGKCSFNSWMPWTIVIHDNVRPSTGI